MSYQLHEEDDIVNISKSLDLNTSYNGSNNISKEYKKQDTNSKKTNIKRQM